MRAVLMFWATPLAFFWSWYFLSLNDISFGTLFFSRSLHDLVFRIYGDVLGVSPALIPGMAARACVFDSFIVLILIGYRRRRALASYLARLQAIIAPAPAAAPEDDRAPPAE
jgi:hypothetical protein